ncbi:NADH-dependent flavin oxidoreductase [Diatrype stigma]|uniref:NADH-dependent flavin oxidoreductase n=1 Tax=Diatrype stigma TaxID=117547 RepID=A0AAN9V3N2_9PEZI
MSSSTSSLVNKAAPGAPYFTPAQEPPAGTALAGDAAPAPASTPTPTLFQPLQIRAMALQNRFAVSPMCQYSAADGHVTDWHFAHLSQFFLRGVALTIVEATAVTANGRITPEDSGLWKDSQKEPLRRIVDFAHSQGQKMGIQLAHAGRKASTVAPWLRAAHAAEPWLSAESFLAAPENGGWADNVWGPSAIPFADGYATPKAMTAEDIAGFVRSFAEAARRAVDVGFDCIEIHGAHGYLLSEFLSPLSNRRTDRYGGSFENRTRLLFEVIAAVRAVVPASFPLLLRVSATEWMEHAAGTVGASWDLEQTIRLAKLLPDAGVDLLDVSSGGNHPDQKIELHPYHQVNLAGRIREELRKEGKKLLIGAVGLITTAEMARSIVQEGKDQAAAGSGSGSGSGAGAASQDTAVEVAEESGPTTQADLVLIGRQLLREPEFVLRCAQNLGVDVKWPNQYHRAHWRKGEKL